MKNRFLFSAFIVIYSFTSCNTYRYIYSASPANTPYFKEKGESKVTAYYSTAGDNGISKEYAHGFDLQGAYAFGNHWALTAGYFNRKEKDIYHKSFNIFDSSVVKYKRNLIDVGGGYFIFLNPKKSITANLYGGFATGKFSFEDNGIDETQLVYNRYHESEIFKWFFQPSINFMPGKYFRFSFAPKISYVHYGNVKTSYTPDEFQFFNLERITNRTVSFFEPSMNLQLGIPDYPWIKIDGVFSFTSYYNPDNPHLNVRGFNASIGLNFDFSKMKKENNIKYLPTSARKP